MRVIGTTSTHFCRPWSLPRHLLTLEEVAAILRVDMNLGLSLIVPRSDRPAWSCLVSSDFSYPCLQNLGDAAFYSAHLAQR